MKKLLLFLFVCSSFVSFSQEKAEPVVWKVSYIDRGNNEGEIIFAATIADKHHIYSQRPTDAGPIATSFTITPNASYKAIDKVTEPEAHEAYEEVFDAKVASFEKEVIFKQKISRKSSKAFNISTYVEYTCCNDRMCLPPKTLQFMVTIPESATPQK
jgi:thiol:disulfide interchange protein DsbD